jgi:hypothetical protein
MAVQEEHPMRVRFGRHRRLSVAKLVLAHPDYVWWALSQGNPSEGLAEVRREARRLIARFDARPLVVKCRGRDCGRDATRCSVCLGSTRRAWWCPECDPAQQGVAPGPLQFIATYLEAVEYVNTCCGGDPSAMQALVGALARAKGLPADADEPEAQGFFAERPPLR